VLFLYFVELSWLLVDSFSGYFINHGIYLPFGQSVASLFRIVVTIYFIYFLIRFHNKKLVTKIALIALIVLISLSLVHLFLYGAEYVIHGLQFSLKVLYPFILFSIIKVQIDTGYLSFKKFKNIIYVNYSVLVVNVFLGVLGIGFAKYGQGADGFIEGGKGFFFSGNELSGAFLALVSLMLILNVNKSTVSNAFVISISFITALLLFSKTTFAGFILILFFYLFFVLKNRFVFYSMLLIPPLFALITFEYWIDFLLNAFARWEHFMSIGTSFTDGLTSGRTRRLDEFWWLLETDSLFLLIGLGGYYKAVLSVELDFFDLLIRLGIFITLIVYIFWGYLAFINVRFGIKKRSREAIMACYSICLLVCVGLIAGHVMYSAMLAPFIIFLALFFRIPPTTQKLVL
tara:strand:- start:6907 stop:8112 length:1206 start_codon:yes stop_codon:yes gene_type:complete